MAYDPDDTIAAIGTADSGAARGMVRISGPSVLDCLRECFVADDDNLKLETLNVSSVIPGSFRVGDLSAVVPCDLFLWPDDRSYTRQPTAELHTLGSPPLLAAVLNTVCSRGARVAQPGEFTLRAFLAGRLDLTQAEAVLGVIDARGQQDLDVALAQLAGGLSQPLSQLREQLLQLLADLEAGLDFVEEDLEFISSDDLARRLLEAQQIVSATFEQMSQRGGAPNLPRVVLVGPPNVGKSSLFNALVEACAADSPSPHALVTDRAGTTRDYLTAVVDLGVVVCELIDTAGEDSSTAPNSIQQIAQNMASQQRQQADLRLHCIEASENGPTPDELPKASHCDLLVLTKSDLSGSATTSTTGSVITCSSLTGLGIDTLKAQIGRQLERNLRDAGHAVASTSARCAESLRLASEALGQALELLGNQGGEELIAAEVRHALLELGRVVGAVYTDDILDRIFSQFCIGK